MTPLVKIEQQVAKNVTLLAKLEGENVTGSIKDRFARQIILAAQASGQLRPAMTIVEVSSGNSALALAHVARETGYASEFYLPDSIDETVLEDIRAYGAQVTLCSQEQGSDFALEQITNKCVKGRHFWPKQYFNPQAADSYHCVASEIEEQCGEANIPFTLFCASVGTGATLLGVGKKLKVYRPDVKTIACYAASLNEGIAGVRTLGMTFSHTEHQELYDAQFPDYQVEVTHAQAQQGLALLQENDIRASLSSGAAIYASLLVAREQQAAAVVTVLADAKRGETYEIQL